MKQRTWQRKIGVDLGSALCGILLFAGTTAWAENEAETKPSKATQPAESLPYSQCFEKAAKQYSVDADLLRSIAWQESKFNPLAHNTKNATPSEDVGLMQINSWWLGKLAGYGITRADLWEPCTNIHVGAWILSSEIARHSNIWTAVGYYNAKTKWKRERYAGNVKRALVDLKSGALLAAYISKQTGTAVARASTKAVTSRTLKTIPAIAAVNESSQRPTKRVVSMATMQKKKPEIVVVGDS